MPAFYGNISILLWVITIGCSAHKKTTDSNPTIPVSNASVSETIWIELSQDELRMLDIPDTMPSAYSIWKLDTAMMNSRLNKAGHNGEIIPFPTPDRKIENYMVHTVSTVSDQLLDAFPEIMTYEGINTLEKRETGRFDLNRNGFHGTIYSLNGTILINPLSMKNKIIYLCSYQKDSRNVKGDFEK